MSWRSKAKSLLTNDRGKCYAPIHKEKKIEANKKHDLHWIMELFGKG